MGGAVYGVRPRPGVEPGVVGGAGAGPRQVSELEPPRRLHSVAQARVAEGRQMLPRVHPDLVEPLISPGRPPGQAAVQMY